MYARFRIPGQLDIPGNNQLLSHLRFSRETELRGNDPFMHQAIGSDALIVRYLDDHALKSFHILQGLEQQSGRLNWMNSISECSGTTILHVIHFVKFLAFKVLCNGTDGPDRYRERPGFLTNIFYLGLCIDDWSGVGNNEYICIASCGCSISAGFQSFFEFISGIAEIGENVHPARRDMQTFMINDLVRFGIDRVTNFLKNSVYHQNILNLSVMWG